MTIFHRILQFPNVYYQFLSTTFIFLSLLSYKEEVDQASLHFLSDNCQIDILVANHENFFLVQLLEALTFNFNRGCFSSIIAQSNCCKIN